MRREATRSKSASIRLPPHANCVRGSVAGVGLEPLFRRERARLRRYSIVLAALAPACPRPRVLQARASVHLGGAAPHSLHPDVALARIRAHRLSESMGTPILSLGATSSSIASMIEGTPAITITLPIQKPGAPDTLLRMRSAPWGMRVRRRRASFISAPVVLTHSCRMVSARGSLSLLASTVGIGNAPEASPWPVAKAYKGGGWSKKERCPSAGRDGAQKLLPLGDTRKSRENSSLPVPGCHV